MPFALALAAACLGCGAVYPELSTAVRAPAPGAALEPGPAEDLYYFYFEGAVLPARTQDGREWGGAGPDSYAKLRLGERDLLVTPAERATRKPTWPDQERANYRIPEDAPLFVEVWDARAISDHPICSVRVVNISGLREDGGGTLQCDSGARVFVHVATARAVLGIGLFYELRGSGGVRVTRVLPRSPAERAGLGSGDTVLSIEGVPVTELDALGVRSKINANLRTGVTLVTSRDGGAPRTVELFEGPIYPLRGEGIALPPE
jgi:hypothetical protein